MITVYSANRCEDTRRSLRHGVAHRYHKVDESLEAVRRTWLMPRPASTPTSPVPAEPAQ
jgi:hypothetical protein